MKALKILGFGGKILLGIGLIVGTFVMNVIGLLIAAICHG